MSFGSEAIKLLAQYEVDTIFGIPGVHTIEYYRGITETGMRTVVPRHEQGAGFMADGYSRIANKPGVCVLVSGPGVLNASTPIAQAWHDSVPMLVVAASTDTELRGRNRGPLHDVPDQAAFFDQLTYTSKTVNSPEEFAEVIGKTFHSWETSRPRPVHISVPTDVLEHDTGAIAKYSVQGSAPTASADQINAVVTALKAAKKPLIIAGGGALRAAREIEEIATVANVPVITTGNARGILPEAHPMNVGTLLPFPATQAMIAAADLVIAIGTEFTDVDIIYTGKRIQKPSKLVRVDIDKDQLGEKHGGFNADIGIQSDAKVFASAFVTALKTQTFDAASSDVLAEIKKVREGVTWTAQSVSHFPWIDAITASIPQNTIVSIDSTQLAYTAHHYMPWSAAGKWLAPYGLGTLGPALPMALGARAADANAPILVLAGDGGFLFTIQELATARDMGGKLVIIIWDNAGYGEIRDSFDRAKASRNGVDVQTFDLVTIAKGFGLASERITSPAQLSQALNTAFAANTPTVLVVTEPGSPADK